MDKRWESILKLILSASEVSQELIQAYQDFKSLSGLTNEQIQQWTAKHADQLEIRIDQRLIELENGEM